MPVTPTRERIVAEAMRLFSEQGYQSTKITQIEAAAGLAPGSGALYHHFKSKESLLEAGIDRQLDRRHAMHDIRTLFAGLGDVRVELTMLGRYLLGVLDEETQLLQIAARTPPEQSPRLDVAYAALIDGLRAEVADWLQGWAPGISGQDGSTIAAIAVDALLGRRTSSVLFRGSPTTIADERYVAEWTAMIAHRIENLAPSD